MTRQLPPCQIGEIITAPPDWAALPQLMLTKLNPRARMLLRVRPKPNCSVIVSWDEIFLCRPYVGQLSRSSPGTVGQLFRGGPGTSLCDPRYFIVPIELADNARRALIDAGPWR